MKLDAYPKYRSSGIEWLGEVPEHWEAKAIKWVSPVRRGASPRPIDDPSYFDEEGTYAWVRISDVSAASMYLYDTTQYLSELGKAFSVPMEPGSLFLSIAGSVGKPCITKIKCCIHDGFVYFPNWNADSRFLYYLFESGELYGGLGKLGTQLNLNTDTVGGIVVGFPPTTEQHSIADFLDREISKIDVLVARKQTLIERLKEKRTALIARSVTRGLPPDAARAARLDPHPKLKPSGFEWLGEVPEHWEVKRLRFISPHITVGIVVEPSKYYEDQGVPCLRSLNVQPNALNDRNLVYISRESNHLLSKSILRRGDLVAVRSGQPGTTAVVDDRFDGANCIDLIIIRKPPNGSSTFFSYFLNSIPAQTQFMGGAGGAIQQHFNIGTASDLILVEPSPDEQHAIADFLDLETTKIDDMAANVETAIKRLREYRSALITAAVTGKIDVREATE